MRGQVRPFALAFVSTCLFVCAASSAGERAAGWRGDGTGKYPDADPPAAWGRVSKAVKGLRYRAGKPNDGDAGSPMPDGVIRDWLILGPVPIPEGAKADQDALPNEPQLDPVEGDKAGEASWKKVTVETNWIDFATLTGKPGKSYAYAATNILSDAGGAFRMNLTSCAPVRVILNGKPLKDFASRVRLDLVKGWNRLVLKATGGEAGWFLGPVLHAFAPAQYENSSIAWMTPLPGLTGGFYGGGMGVGSPIIVGDRMYLLSEPHDLICLSKADGKILWVRANSYYDAATQEERNHPSYKEAEPLATALGEINASFVQGMPPAPKLAEKAKLENEIYAKMKAVDEKKYKRGPVPDVGFSGLAPVTDGKFVYLWLATGVTACYDLDGNRKWIRTDNLPAIEHGFSSSPVLVDGKVVIFMRDLIAVDAKTGAIAWQVPLVPHQGFNPPGYFHGTPCALTVGGVRVIALGNGTIVRADDGKALYKNPGMGNQAICSPVVEGDLLVQVPSWSMIMFLHKIPVAFADPLKPETRQLKVDTQQFPKYYVHWHMASPVVHEGLAYLLNNSGVLTVVDVEKAQIVYQKLLDLDHFQFSNEGAARGIGVSPALAGKRLYLFGNNGGALVIEPGREYRQVAKNKIENVVATDHWGQRQERFVANPVFDGKRLYVRGEQNLYAIGP